MVFFIRRKGFGLFGAEGVYGFQLGGLVCGQESEHDADHHRASERQRDGIRGDDRGNRQERSEFHDAVTEGDADGASEEGQYDRLGKELHHDVGIKGSDGPSDAYFPRALRDRHEHDVHDSDASDHERYRRYAHEKHFERVGNARHGGEHVGRTRNREIRACGVFDLELREVVVGNRGLGRVHRVRGRRHDDELRHVLVSEEAVLQGGHGNVDGVVGARHRPAS